MPRPVSPDAGDVIAALFHAQVRLGFALELAAEVAAGLARERPRVLMQDTDESAVVLNRHAVQLGHEGEGLGGIVGVMDEVGHAIEETAKTSPALSISARSIRSRSSRPTSVTQ